MYIQEFNLLGTSETSNQLPYG